MSVKKDLSIEFAGIKCRNPFFLSSSPVGNNYDMIAKCFEAGWGGVFYKTCLLYTSLTDLPKSGSRRKEEQSLSLEELPVSLPDILAQIEDEYIALAMKKGGSIRKASKLLNLSPTTLFRKINRD